MWPIDAAVIPLPSEDTTPPVTKTYFDNWTPLRFFRFYGLRGARGERRLPEVSDSRLQHDHPGLRLGRARLHRETRLRLRLGHPHLLEKALDGLQLRLQGGQRVVHRDDDTGLDLPY